MKFWDASVIIPLCLEEPRTPLLKKVSEEDEAIVVWWGTPVECYSAFARLRREGVLSADDEDQACYILGRLATAWTEVEPSQEVREQAQRVLRLHPVRAADALQLAAALVWVQGQPFGQHFVCLDRRLREAAQREGFLIFPASEQPQEPRTP
ncbi:MAG: type II toxin-antitoxin system VapC family toxin [Candidatus Tectomicrobia bacterium]